MAKLQHGKKNFQQISPDVIRAWAKRLHAIAEKLEVHAADLEELKASPFSAPVGNLNNAEGLINEWTVRYVIPKVLAAAQADGRQIELTIARPDARTKKDHQKD